MDRRHFIRLAGVSAAALTATGALPALALDGDAAAAHVRTTVDEVLALVQTGSSAGEKAEKLRAIMERRAAIPQIARFAAGPAWRDMSPEQQSRYQAAFAQFVATIYARRFQDYSGETVTIGRTLDAGKKGVLVQSEVSQKSQPPVKVEWLVNDRTGSVLIADIVIEGVSLVTTQREEVSGMLDARGGDVEGLIEALRSA